MEIMHSPKTKEWSSNITFTWIRDLNLHPALLNQNLNFKRLSRGLVQVSFGEAQMSPSLRSLS